MKTFSSKRSVGFHKQLDSSELMALKNIFPCTWFFFRCSVNGLLFGEEHAPAGAAKSNEDVLRRAVSLTHPRRLQKTHPRENK